MITRRALLTAAALPALPLPAAEPRLIDDRTLVRSTYLFLSSPPMTVSVMPILRALPDGRLICIFVSGGDREPLDDNRPLVSYSSDDGKTWTPAANFPTIEGQMTFCCEIENEGQRVTAHLFSGKAADHYKILTNYRVISTDSGKTWGEPQRYDLAPEGVVLSQRVTLKDGTILFPFFHNHKTSSVWIHQKGKAPRLGGEVGAEGQQLITPRVVELRDGRLVMLLRAQGQGYLWRAESTDGGLTWSKPAPTTKPSPVTRFWFKKLTDGRYALIDNPTSLRPDGKSGPRDPLELWISDDEMKSWSLRVVLDRGQYHTDRPAQKSRMGYAHQLAYPEAVERNGKLHVAYDYNRRDVVFLTLDLKRIS